jgi:hypothetical protein
MKPALGDPRENQYEQMTRRLLHHGIPDIVLMGSSRPRCALVPDVFEAETGERAYNAAINSSYVVEWQLLAKRLFADQQPSLVVLGINAYEMRANYAPKMAARYLFTFSDFLEYLQNGRPSVDVVGAYLRHEIEELGLTWATLDNRNGLKIWFQERLAQVLPKHAQAARELRERLTGPGVPDGYDHPSLGKWRRPGKRKSWLDVAPAAIAPDVLEFSPKAYAFSQFDLLLDWFHSEHIALLVVYLPNCPADEERWAELEPEMIEAIARVCQDHQVPFLRCAQSDLPRTNAEFFDATHVDPALARRISGRIAREINVLGLLNREGPRLAGTGDTDAGSP